MDYKLIYLARRNPSVAAEDWPRTWRSHAVFVSGFPVIGARVDSLFYCSRVLAPTLGGAPFEPPGASVAYDGVAVISSPSPEHIGAGASPEARARIDADELRVFSTNTAAFSFRCKEVLVDGGAPGQAAVIRFLARKPGSSIEAFSAHWSQRHADIATRAARAGTRYVHNALTEDPPPGYPFDGITETWFGDAEEAARSFVDPQFQPVAQDLPAFCDMQRTVTLLVHVTHRWPRASAAPASPATDARPVS